MTREKTEIYDSGDMASLKKQKSFRDLSET